MLYGLVIGLFTYLNKVINNPSMIAAIMSSGIIIKMNTLIEFFRFGFSFLILLIENSDEPNFNPRPMEIKMAGSSNIPWGRSLHSSNMFVDETTFSDTYPTSKPFVIAFTIGGIPKINPRNNEKNDVIKLFLKINEIKLSPLRFFVESIICFMYLSRNPRLL